MYRQFYQFHQDPFADTPEPAWLFLSASHRAALQAIARGVAAQRGYITVFGKAGLGKTMLLHAYMASIDQRQCKTIYVNYPAVTRTDILDSLCQACGFGTGAACFPDATHHLQQVLLTERQQGKNVVLIIDDAQHLSPHNLESLLMLLHLETTSGQLLQVIFAGHPAFRQRLQRAVQDQSKKNTGVRVTLSPLSKRASRDYIHHRLQKSLSRPGTVFSKRALRKIVAYAGGIPRSLNTLCTEVLILGTLNYQKPISGALAHQVVRDFAREQPVSLLRRGMVYVYTAGLVLLLTLVWEAQYWQRVWPAIHDFTRPPLSRLTTETWRLWHEELSPMAVRLTPSAPPSHTAMAPETQNGGTPVLPAIQSALKAPDKAVPRAPEARRRAADPMSYRESRPQAPVRADGPRPDTEALQLPRPPAPSRQPEPVATISPPAQAVAPAPERPELRPDQDAAAPPAFTRRILRILDKTTPAPERSPHETTPPPQSLAAAEPEAHTQQKHANPTPETIQPIITQAPVHVANINSLPEHATVIINGKPVGITPLTVTMALGRHTIRVEKVGYTSIRYDVTFDAAGTSNLYHDLHLTGSSP
jgi:general secretion pathway protein A